MELQVGTILMDVGGEFHEDLHMNLLSRRELFRVSWSALVCLIARRIMGAKTGAPLPILKVSLAREFPKRQVLDISPDGLKLCFDYWGDAKYPMEVAEISTGKIIFSGSFATRVWAASFFSDSKTLIAESRIALGSRKSVPHLTLVDLQTGERIEGRHFTGNPYENDYARAVSDNILLLTDMDWSSMQKCYLVLAEFPSFREIARVPVVIRSGEPERSMPGNSGFQISGDRSIFVCSYGQTLVCRRTKDLKALWTRKIEPPVTAKGIVTSSDGGYVAVAIADTAIQDKQKEYYISIFNGKTGADVARLPLSGTEELALSPDGSLLAVVDNVSNKTRKEWVPTVHIHDVSSGKRLASVIHDRYESKKVRRVYAGCTVYFTSDGKYLITSGINTKVWKLDASSPE
jgi:WD40 repeat protein